MDETTVKIPTKAGNGLACKFNSLKNIIDAMTTCPLMTRGVESPILYDFKLNTLNAKRTPPRITSNLMAEMLLVSMKKRIPKLKE